jgi:hypothetical protein
MDQPRAPARGGAVGEFDRRPIAARRRRGQRVEKVTAHDCVANARGAFSDRSMRLTAVLATTSFASA